MQPIRITDPEEQKEFPPLEALPFGEYRCRLEKLEDKPGYNVGDDPQWLWTFRVMDDRFPQHVDHPIWKYTGQNAGEYREKNSGAIMKTLARQILEAILKRSLAVGEELNREDLIGGTLMIGLGVEIHAKSGQLRNKALSFRADAGEVTTGTTRTAHPGFIEVARTSYDHELQARYDNAQKLLKWNLEKIKATILWIGHSDEPFFRLDSDQKLKVVEYMEQDLRDNDAPGLETDGTVELDFSEPERVGAVATKAPASTKHKTA